MNTDKQIINIKNIKSLLSIDLPNVYVIDIISK